MGLRELLESLGTHETKRGPGEHTLGSFPSGIRNPFVGFFRSLTPIPLKDATVALLSGVENAIGRDPSQIEAVGEPNGRHTPRRRVDHTGCPPLADSWAAPAIKRPVHAGHDHPKSDRCRLS